MLNPGGRSVKFDEFNPQAVFNPRSYYDYEPYSAATVRSIVPMFAGADKVDFWAQNNSALPVDLVAFNGVLETNKVVLNWKTANEKNTNHYAVERSDNALQFEEVGKVLSSKSSAANAYTFTDSKPLEGKSYYHLKVV